MGGSSNARARPVGMSGHHFSPSIINAPFVKRWAPVAAAWGAFGLLTATYIIEPSAVFDYVPLWPRKSTQ